METPVGRALLRLTGVVLVAVAVVALVAPRAANIEYRWQVVVPTVLVVLVVAAVAHVPRWVENLWVPVVVAVGGGVLATWVGLMGRYEYGWDARVIMDMARSVSGGRPLTDSDYGYLSLFPNNLPLLAIDRLGVEVGRSLGLSPDAVLITLNGICVAVTVYAVHLLVVRVAGRGPALAAQLATLALVGTSPWLSVPYTDFYAMPFVVGGVALADKALAPGRRSTRIIMWVLAIAAITIAYSIKTTPVVVVIAAVLTAVIATFDHGLPTARRMGVVGACAASVLGFVLLGTGLANASMTSAGVDSSRIDDTVTPPLLWWVAMGSLEHRGSTGAVAYGAYSGEMVTAVRGQTQGQMRDYAGQVLSGQWSERGIVGTAEFYGNKVAWNWGDGMFWAWGEGNDASPEALAPATGATEVLHEVNGLHGTWYQLRADLAQGLWIAVLIVAGLGLLRAPYRRETVLVAVSVLGIAAFTLVFQGRSRYLFAFVPLVVALAGMAHAWLPARRRRTADTSVRAG
ncbi:hypothetical protein GCM10027053_22720 [Intrasporangium mesophilum]